MDIIKKAYQVNVDKLDKVFMSYDWRNKNAYARYLAQTYYYICHSAKLLNLAAEAAPTDHLKEYLNHHASEERGHEHWASGDLKKLGYKLADYPENDTTKALYMKIYDGIERVGPAAIVGYAMALEGMSACVCPKLTPTLVQLYGAKSSSFIKNHGEKDPGHTEESFEILKFFGASEHKTIVEYMNLTTKCFMAFMQEISVADKAAA